MSYLKQLSKPWKLATFPVATSSLAYIGKVEEIVIKFDLQVQDNLVWVIEDTNDKHIQATKSEEPLMAYRKFLKGEKLKC